MKPVRHHQLVLEIADNGIGMSDTAPVVAGHGLKNMQARATDIGATLRFDTPTEGGSRVAIVLPVHPVTDAEKDPAG